MKILAIETSTPASSVAIGEGSELVAMSVRVDARGHGGFLVPAMDFCFSQAGWSPNDIEVVAVDVGPGPFTGLRAGLATAQAVAAAVGARIVIAESVTVLALRAATGRRRIWPIVDVRRGEFATAPFRPVPGGVVRDGPTEIYTPSDLRALLDADDEDALLVGNHSLLPGEALRGMHRVKTGRPRYPSADVLLEIASMRASRGDFVESDSVRPMYLRDADARINWKTFREEGVWPGPE